MAGEEPSWSSGISRQGWLLAAAQEILCGLLCLPGAFLWLRLKGARLLSCPSAGQDRPSPHLHLIATVADPLPPRCPDPGLHLVTSHLCRFLTILSAPPAQPSNLDPSGAGGGRRDFSSLFDLITNETLPPDLGSLTRAAQVARATETGSSASSPSPLLTGLPALGRGRGSLLNLRRRGEPLQGLPSGSWQPQDTMGCVAGGSGSLHPHVVFLCAQRPLHRTVFLHDDYSGLGATLLQYNLVLASHFFSDSISGSGVWTSPYECCRGGPEFNP